MLEKFHTAVLIVCLDSGKWSDHASLAESAALHGSKEELENRWYDKHQMIVSADGQLAFNFEASCSDRVHWAYWIEHVLRVANAAPPAVVKDDTTFDFTRLVQPLEITFGKSFAAHIRNARLEAHHIVEDLEVHSVHIPYGKEKIALLNEAEVNKGVRITPDAFAQLVLQLAHDTLRDRLTAASQLCSVANFFHGLTALARTMTAELAQVIHILNEMERKALPKLEAESEINLSNAGDGTVKPVAVALDSGKSFLASHITSTEDKQKLAAAMRAAITAHHGQVLAATRGEGIDRHMLVLDHHVRVNGDKAGLAFFEDELQKLSSSYLLSTSSFSREWLQYYTFGPQRENGYGLGYVIDRHEMRVSLTAFTNSPATNVSDLTSAILFYSDMVYHLLGGSK
ncbi:carnitine/choline acetyltransferase [Angomonas deanei]|nr:carnitine/choline acetyltransferase [Angomonas deanei]|eukprot:EPY38539.1 carnitine/choline acetyltransferase [Angomonas deanei]